MSETNPGSGRDPVEQMLESFLARWRRGERPGLEEYAARCPERADEIRELFPAMIEMEQLKPAAESATSFLGRPSTRPDSTSRPEPAHPERLGDFKILRVIGEGGMGVVFEAEHESLKSRVALKVMHRRFRTDQSYLRRFQTEARSAARLHHTNIVPVFDFGEQDGICYYAMQYIVGFGLDRVLDDVRRLRAEADAAPPSADAAAVSATEALADPVSAVTRGLMTGRFSAAPATATGAEALPTEVLDDGPTQSLGFQVQYERQSETPSESETSSSTNLLSGHSELVYFREIARLGAQVADALDYAHRQKVVHRDIKPPNLLLDAQGNVWVTDFGLAKLVEGEDLSQSHDLAGTLRFMAPERLRGVTDRRSDIYALGATLYEMLALKPAFPERDQVKLIDQIAHQAPTPLRKHDPRIPCDMETIVHKVLAKDPNDRCDKAGELRDELRRFLEGRPTRWRRVGSVEQFRRWCKRNPWLAAANITAAVLTTVLAIGSTLAAWIYRDQRNEIGQSLKQVQKAEADGRERLFESLVSQAQARRVSRRMGQRFQTLDALTRAAAIAQELKLPPSRLDPLRDEAIACLALPDLRPTGRVITRPPGVIAFAFDSTMTRYALRFRDGTIEVRLVADDQLIAQFKARGDREFFLFGFSPDGRYLATKHFPGMALTVWDIEKRMVVLDDQGPIPGEAAKFSPDSRAIAVAHGDGEFVIYDLATGIARLRWRGLTPSDPEFSPDGTQIALIEHGSDKETCRIIDSQSGRLIRSFQVLSVEGWHQWSPDGATLAICGDRKIYLWDVATGLRKVILEGHVNSGVGAMFHPTGTLLASNGWEGRLWLWDPVLGRPWLTMTGGSRFEFSRDGRIVLEHEDQLTAYQVDPALEYRTFTHVSSQRTDCDRASVHHAGRVQAVGGNRGVALWDLARGAELAFLAIGHAPHSMFDGSGDLLTSGSTGVQRWPVHLDLDRGEFRIGPPRQLPLPAGPESIDADRSGRIVALADYGLAFVATPERTFHVGPLDDCRSVAVSPDGEWLATGTHRKNGA